MKKNILIVLLSLVVISLFSQSTLPRFNGWVDDENFILEKKDKKGNLPKSNSMQKVERKLIIKLPLVFHLLV